MKNQTSQDFSFTYTGVDNLEIMMEAENYNHFLIQSVLKFSGNKKRVLDFGAGIGYFAKSVREFKTDLTCIEIDSRLADQLRSNGFKTFSQLNELPKASFDFIYSLNVLEHIEHDQAILEQMFECLQPGGLIYIYVPAFNVLYSSMDKKVGHLRRYKIENFRKLISPKQGEILHWSYCDSIGFFLSLVFKMIGNKRGDLNPSTIKFYDRVLFPLNKIFDFFFSRVLGKNLQVVIKKHKF